MRTRTRGAEIDEKKQESSLTSSNNQEKGSRNLETASTPTNAKLQSKKSKNEARCDGGENLDSIGAIVFKIEDLSYAPAESNKFSASLNFSVEDESMTVEQYFKQKYEDEVAKILQHTEDLISCFKNAAAQKKARLSTQ